MKDLKKVLNFFSLLNEESKAILESLLAKKEFKKKEFIIKTGEIPENFYVLTKGVVRSYLIDKDKKEHTRSFFIPISTTGSIGGLISNKKSILNYECLTNCELYYGNFKILKRLMEERIDFSNQYNKILEIIFYTLEAKIYDLSVLNATERYLKMKKEFPDIENLIAQYHIASYLNISAVQLSRIRKEIIEKKLL